MIQSVDSWTRRGFKKDKLTVKVMVTRTEMGQVAAQDIHDRILALLAEKDEINMIFAWDMG